MRKSGNANKLQDAICNVSMPMRLQRTRSKRAGPTIQLEKRLPTEISGGMLVEATWKRWRRRGPKKITHASARRDAPACTKWKGSWTWPKQRFRVDSAFEWKSRMNVEYVERAAEGEVWDLGPEGVEDSMKCKYFQTKNGKSHVCEKTKGVHQEGG